VVTCSAKDRQRVGHTVDGFRQGGHFAFGFDRQLLFEAAVGDGRNDFDDTADLRVKLAAMTLTLSVKSFQVPATPGTKGLAAELAFGADFAGDAGHFGGERRSADRPWCSWLA
jgi:hypothetical protein